MSTVCQICGKGTSSGSRIVRHGLAKKKGGIGLHTTAVTKRVFKANLQKLRVKVGGGVKTLTVCASCIKAGKVTKAGKVAKAGKVTQA
jgi:large subunit ribosomal protein L28